MLESQPIPAVEPEPAAIVEPLVGPELDLVELPESEFLTSTTPWAELDEEIDYDDGGSGDDHAEDDGESALDVLLRMVEPIETVTEVDDPGALRAALARTAARKKPGNRERAFEPPNGEPHR